MNQNPIVDVVLPAVHAASAGVEIVMGVTGIWSDDGDGVVNAVDTVCGGIATSSVGIT